MLQGSGIVLGESYFKTMQIIWLSFTKGNSVFGYAISQSCKDCLGQVSHSMNVFPNSVICVLPIKNYILPLMLKSAVNCYIGLGMVALHISEVVVFLLWVDWCLCSNHGKEPGILLLKYDRFPAANLGQESSKQIFLFLSMYALHCHENADTQGAREFQ